MERIQSYFFQMLRAKKHGTTAYLDALFVFSENPEEAYLRLEAENSLHREIAMLSENYRKAVVLYYFEGKRCSEIGKILGKSTGTVKWWLHDARNLIKKGLDTMRKYGEKSYHPGTLFMSCQGMPGADNQPMSCAKRMLPQNILLAAYEIPLSVEQLCTELGTPAAYVEDEVKNLVFNQLMKESPGRPVSDGFCHSSRTGYGYGPQAVCILFSVILRNAHPLFGNTQDASYGQALQYRKLFMGQAFVGIYPYRHRHRTVQVQARGMQKSSLFGYARKTGRRQMDRAGF